nr:RING-H2 finger protein ATL66-like [Ipomoea batatas]
MEEFEPFHWYINYESAKRFLVTLLFFGLSLVLLIFLFLRFIRMHASFPSSSNDDDVSNSVIVVTRQNIRQREMGGNNVSVVAAAASSEVIKSLPIFMHNNRLSMSENTRLLECRFGRVGGSIANPPADDDGGEENEVLTGNELPSADAAPFSSLSCFGTDSTTICNDVVFPPPPLGTAELNPRLVPAAPPCPHTTGARQNGQEEWENSHISIHSAWNAWPHFGNFLPTSPFSNQLKQILHSIPLPSPPPPLSPPFPPYTNLGISEMADFSRPFFSGESGNVESTWNDRNRRRGTSTEPPLPLRRRD